MYVCMCVCMYACIAGCMHACMQASMHTWRAGGMGGRMCGGGGACVGEAGGEGSAPVLLEHVPPAHTWLNVHAGGWGYGPICCGLSPLLLYTSDGADELTR